MPCQGTRTRPTAGEAAVLGSVDPLRLLTTARSCASGAGDARARAVG